MRSSSNGEPLPRCSRWEHGLRRIGIWSASAVLLVGCAAPEQETGPSATMTPAVSSLVEDARQASQLKQYALATAQLERALRIEPANPDLWRQLAEVKLAEGYTAEAIQFALKSNALTADGGLRSRNWRLVAAAYTMQGDRDRAREANEKAAAE